MDNPEFPPNSEASRRVIEDKNLTRVTSGEAIRKKKPLRKRFQESIVGGTPGMAVSYVVMDVLLPAAKDMIVESVYSGVEKLIFGDSRRHRGVTRPESGNFGYVNYSRFSGPMSPMSGGRLSSSQRAMSRQARARHDFDEILLDSRTEAEEVIDQLFEVINRYGAATVADLYDLVGLASNHQDHKWGWTDIRGAGVSRDRNGYLLDLPDPHPLD
jgi:hypothetical protein